MAHLHHADLPQLDELAGSESKGELPLLRSQQWTHPIPGVVNDNDDDDNDNDVEDGDNDDADTGSTDDDDDVMMAITMTMMMVMSPRVNSLFSDELEAEDDQCNRITRTLMTMKMS